MNSTLASLINIPLLFLVYVMAYFTQSLSGKRQFYGVSLNSDYFKKKEFKSLDEKFKILLTIGFFVFTLITLIIPLKFIKRTTLYLEVIIISSEQEVEI